ncbi:heavy metal translocating P-type ATPase [Halorussus halobius]|uniref:heavy metal translocating P-type ATPase n=1 Tax=Halorussus halobius TaxID=1710537 RepID=UPI0010923B44|nr:heavy metal translocating P-type ATPase [Halorussus halobius]
MTRGDPGRTVRLSVPEMDCPSCAGKVTASVESLDGVRDTDAAPTTGTLAVTYDPESTDGDAVRERIEAAGYAVAGESDADRELRLSVPEMDCASCAGKVERALAEVDADAVETRPTTGEVVVTGEVDPDEVRAAVEGAGYEVAESSASAAGDDAGPSVAEKSDVWTSPRALKTWVGAALLVAGLAVEFVFSGADAVLFGALGREFHVSSVLLLLAAGIAGQAILRNGYYSAKTLSLDIDLLMGTGVVSAVAVGLYVEAATLAVLFSVAELLEQFSMDRARDSMRELVDLSPDTATVRRGGEGDTGEETVPVEEVAVGETVVVRPGEKIPVDGDVLEGASAVNQAPITGESVPVDKRPGDEVYAGTVNEEGYLEVESTARAHETTLSQVVELVGDAQRDRTDHEQFVDRFASYYTPIIVVGALVTAFVPPLVFGEVFRVWFVRGLTLLVVACPCAFVISTPVSVVSGVTSAARNGVLVKGGPHLESVGEVEAVAFDKTGTLTAGELTVTDAVAFGENSEADLLRCAHDLERRSEHPIAEAIVSEAHERSDPHDEDGDDREIENFQSLTGKGVRADLGGVTHYAGKPGLFEELGFDLGHVHLSADAGDSRTGDESVTDGGQVVADAADSKCADREDCLDLLGDVVPRFQREGKTVVLVGTDEELEGVLAIADEVRPAARETVARLRSFGVETVMLTGDNEGTARAVAEQVGVDEFHAELLPEDKVAAVEDLTDRHGSVAMVGDGVNDAPALAAATVGVAMGAAGTDTAIETADIALLGDDLRKVPYLYRLSRKANRVIRQNIWASLAVKAVLAVGAPLGYVPVAMAIVVGDMGMSLGVTGNAMRLARVEPETDE